MKVFTLMIVLSGILLLSGIAGAVDETAKKAAEILEGSTFITRASVIIDGPELTAKLRPTIFERRLLHAIRKPLAELADAVDVANVRLELYDGSVPLFRFSLSREEMQRLRNMPENQVDWLEKFKMEDIRSIERVVADDLQVFSASVHSVKVDENETAVLLSWQGNRASLAETYVAMVLTVVEDTPWVTDVTFIFTGADDSRQRFSVSVESFLALLKEEKSPVAFFESIIHKDGSTAARAEVAPPSDNAIAPHPPKDMGAVTPQPEPSAPANIIVFVAIGIAVAALLGIILFVRSRRKG